jgi:hypothetical protein
LLILFPVFSFISCQDDLRSVPDKYKPFITEALLKADPNIAQIEQAIKQSKGEEKEAVAYMVAYMPERDLKELSSDFIIENVRFAIKARKEFSWCAALPDSIFMNEVLPYASLNEHRDKWRPGFYEKFAPLVRKCQSLREAIDSVNQNIREIVGVEYNTKRKKADQSPYESMEQRMASCTGLSVLLTDAFRSVGIPSRIAGTPMWTNMRGNHNWCEVWIDGHWYFTEYYPEKLNKSWFVADAGKADPQVPFHWIYATSWKPTGLAFPCVWDSSIQYVHAVNVTGFYISLYQNQLNEKQLADDEIILNVVLYRLAESTDGNDRVSGRITVMKDSTLIDYGFTPGNFEDMNKFLPFVLKKNTKYAFIFPGNEGKKKTVSHTTGNISGELLRLNK